VLGRLECPLAVLRHLRHLLDLAGQPVEAGDHDVEPFTELPERAALPYCQSLGEVAAHNALREGKVLGHGVLQQLAAGYLRLAQLLLGHAHGPRSRGRYAGRPSSG
jgi:hypothetical protein